jgi:hypothetical protein
MIDRLYPLARSSYALSGIRNVGCSMQSICYCIDLLERVKVLMFFRRLLSKFPFTSLHPGWRRLEARVHTGSQDERTIHEAPLSALCTGIKFAQ